MAASAASPMSAGPNGTTKFPAFSPDYYPRHSTDSQWRDDLALDHEPSPKPVNDGYWAPRRHSNRTSKWNGQNGNAYHGVRHGRQKSLSEAIRTIRTRNGSISQNAMEIADALKAPVSPTLVVSSIMICSPTAEYIH
jgi:solute carrier family 35, member E1